MEFYKMGEDEDEWGNDEKDVRGVKSLSWNVIFFVFFVTPFNLDETKKRIDEIR